MAGSNFSIVNGSDGVSKVSISTPSNDANGNTVVGHLLMTSLNGVATPVDVTHPVPMTATTLPLPSGAATDVTLVGITAALQTMQMTLALNTSNLAYSRAINAGANPYTALLNSATPGPKTTPAWATTLLILPEGFQMRFRLDALAPDANVGMPVSAGQAWPIQAGTPAQLQAILANLTLFTQSPATINFLFVG